jgi:hypothetical protein
MPYIKPDDRKKFMVLQYAFQEELDKGISMGDFNYIITSMLNAYIDKIKKSYSVFNALIGMLECAKLELYRRVIAGYEDQKVIDNGDVYTPDE